MSLSPTKKIGIVLTLLLFFFSSLWGSEKVAVPAGRFMMGCSEGSRDEQPVREVQVRGFRMHATEVTVDMYQQCVDAGACTPAHYDSAECLQWSGGGFRNVVVPSQYRGSNYPVICVTWFQARAYCQYAGMRLPTEAEWEYAARAGGSARYSGGNNYLSRCVQENNGPAAVGSCPPNQWGLYDMTGNVWEWTADFYEQDAYSHAEHDNPRGPRAGLYRSMRGGGWYSGPSELRVTNRNWFSPGFPEVSVGFRCVQ